MGRALHSYWEYGWPVPPPSQQSTTSTQNDLKTGESDSWMCQVRHYNLALLYCVSIWQHQSIYRSSFTLQTFIICFISCDGVSLSSLGGLRSLFRITAKAKNRFEVFPKTLKLIWQHYCSKQIFFFLNPLYTWQDCEPLGEKISKFQQRVSNGGREVRICKKITYYYCWWWFFCVVLCCGADQTYPAPVK